MRPEEPTRGPDVFLSYKSGDRATAAKLVEALAAEGLAVWWDQHIVAGDAWRQTITDNLDRADCVLVLWSGQSTGADGRFVQDEAARALRRGRYLGVRIESVEMPIGFGGVQTVDLKGWTGDRSDPKFRNLLGEVAAVRAGKRRPVAAPVDAPPTHRAVGRRWVIAAGAGTVAAGALALTLSRDARCAVGLCGAIHDPSSVAVLPFRSIGGGAELAYVADGLTEELRGALARLSSIRVAARISTAALDARGLDTQQLARTLGVTHILDGSVQGGGGQLRINTSLVRADSGFEEWSESFDRAAGDLLAMQSGIATSVARTLRGRLDANEAAAVARRPTESPQAFDAYLRGRRLLDQADNGSEAAAATMFERAILLDPGFAAAHAARARALQSLAIAAPDAASMRRLSAAALAWAQTAMQLTPDLPEVQSTLGFVLQNGQLDFAEARRLYERSLSGAPNDADILVRYGLLAVRTGQTAAGLEALEKATRLDPANPRAFRALGLGRYGARDWRGAIAPMRRALALAPGLAAGHATIGDALVQLGDLAGAVAEYGREPQGFSRESGLAIALRRAGDAAGAEAAFGRLRAIGEGAAYQEAQVLASWGRADAAIAALERAITLRDAGTVYLRTDPSFDGLRGDPRFAAVLARLKLG